MFSGYQAYSRRPHTCSNTSMGRIHAWYPGSLKCHAIYLINGRLTLSLPYLARLLYVNVQIGNILRLGCRPRLCFFNPLAFVGPFYGCIECRSDLVPRRVAEALTGNLEYVAFITCICRFIELLKYEVA